MGKIFVAFVIQKKTNLCLRDEMIFLKSGYYTFPFSKLTISRKIVTGNPIKDIVAYRNMTEHHLHIYDEIHFPN